MFIKLINLLKINYNFKKKFFLKKINKNEFKLIKILIKFQIIKYIKKINSTSIIYLNYFNNKPVWNIKNKYKKSNIYFTKLKTLRRITLKKKKIFLISTSIGITTNFFCLQKKLGGVVVCELCLY